MIVYKKLRNNLIAELAFLPDTRTNVEARQPVDNHLCAKYRANKLKVVKIYNMFNPGETFSAGKSLHNGRFSYRVGEVVTAKGDVVLDKRVCGRFRYTSLFT